MSCENQCFGVPGFEVLRTTTAEVWVLFVLYREMHFSIHRRGQIKGRDPWLVVSWNILEDNTPNSSQKLGLGAATPGQTSDPHPWHCQELSGLGQIRSDSHATGDSGPSCRPWQWPNTSFVLLDMWVGWLRSVLSWPHRVVACWAWLAWTGPMKRRDCSWLSHFSSHRCSLFPFCTLLFFFSLSLLVPEMCIRVFFSLLSCSRVGPGPLRILESFLNRILWTYSPAGSFLR